MLHCWFAEAPARNAAQMKTLPCLSCAARGVLVCVLGSGWAPCLLPEKSCSVQNHSPACSPNPVTSSVYQNRFGLFPTEIQSKKGVLPHPILNSHSPSEQAFLYKEQERRKNSSSSSSSVPCLLSATPFHHWWHSSCMTSGRMPTPVEERQVLLCHIAALLQSAQLHQLLLARCLLWWEGDAKIVVGVRAEGQNL